MNEKDKEAVINHYLYNYMNYYNSYFLNQNYFTQMKRRKN